MSGKIDPLFADHPEFNQGPKTWNEVLGPDTTKRPQGSNADEWHLYLVENQDALPMVAVQIAEAIEAAERRGSS